MQLKTWFLNLKKLVLWMLYWEMDIMQLSLWLWRKLQLQQLKQRHFLQITVSCHTIAWTLNILWAIGCMILWKILKLYPYKDAFGTTIQTARSLCMSWFCFEFSGNNASRQVLAIAYLMDRWASFLFRWCCEYINCCIWGSTNPHAMQQQLLHFSYIMAWCGFTTNLFWVHTSSRKSQ